MPLLQKAYLGSTPLFVNKAWFYDDESSYVDTARFITLNAGDPAHTKGSWTECIASTAGTTSLLSVLISGIHGSGTATGTLLDIAVGASGSETIIAENIAVGAAHASGGVNFGTYAQIPINIPSGTRISARTQCNIASRISRITLFCFDFGDASLLPTSVDVLGADTTTSTGVALAANDTWTEIVSSTAQDYIAFCVVPSSGSDNMVNANDVVYEIGVGAAGSEVGFGDMVIDSYNQEVIIQKPNIPLIMPREVPAGSRIAVRQSANTTTLDATVIAVPKP